MRRKVLVFSPCLRAVWPMEVSVVGRVVLDLLGWDVCFLLKSGLPKSFHEGVFRIFHQTLLADDWFSKWDQGARSSMS